jgi:F-type H+-transporting ATPase subunit gamma
VGKAPEQTGPSAVYTFEPDPGAVLNEILPRFTELKMFHALLEALASEHSARMVAMRTATDNANAMVDDLTLQYNKARQLAITNEILDIVGGAEALSQSISE